MIQHSVCIDIFWEGETEANKIRKVAELGIPAIEFWKWSNKDLDAIAAATTDTNTKVAAFCCETPGSTLTDHSNTSDLTNGVKKSAEIARKLGCSKLIVTTGQEMKNEAWNGTRTRVVSGLKDMAKAAVDENIVLVLEPLNRLVDHRGYFLSRSADAASIVEEVGSPNLKILFDIYHQQITEGNVISNITKYANLIGHFHAAGVPGRHELAGGELDYRSIYAAIEKTGYEGFFGFELSPTGSAEDALREAVSLTAPIGEIA